MTKAEVFAYVASGKFLKWVHSDEFSCRSVEFDWRRDTGEPFTVEAAAAHFKLPVDVFAFVFAGEEPERH